MTNYKNDFIARGIVTEMKLAPYTAQMHKKIKARKTDRFQIVDETCEVEGINGIIKMQSGEEQLVFSVRLIKQAPQFTAGVRQKEFVGYNQMLELQKKFEIAQEAGKELRVQLKGHLEDGTFYSTQRNEFVEQMRWCVEYVSFNPAGKDMCRAMVNAKLSHGKIYIAPPFGNVVLPLLGKVGFTDKEIMETVKSKRTCNLVIERRRREVETEEGYVNFQNTLIVTQASVAEDNNDPYGYVREEYCEGSMAARDAYLEKVMQNAISA